IQEVRLSSKVGGRVADIHTFEGAVVEPDQPLVTFEEPELKAQYEQQLARLRAAEADLDKAHNGPRPEEKQAARAAVESARAHWERLRAGAPEKLREARTALEPARAALNLALEDYARAEHLFRKGSISKAEFDAARAARARAQGRTSSAQSRLDFLSVSRP